MMKYTNQAVARVDDETKFKIKKIRQCKNRGLREIIELGIREYELKNPVFAKKIKLEWINYKLGCAKNNELENNYEIEKLMKEHYKIIISLNKFEKAIEKYYIKDMGDFINAFYEIKLLVEENGDLSSVDEKDLSLISATNDIPLNDLVGACNELLEVLDEE